MQSLIRKMQRLATPTFRQSAAVDAEVFVLDDADRPRARQILKQVMDLRDGSDAGRSVGVDPAEVQQPTSPEPSKYAFSTSGHMACRYRSARQ